MARQVLKRLKIALRTGRSVDGKNVSKPGMNGLPVLFPLSFEISVRPPSIVDALELAGKSFCFRFSRSIFIPRFELLSSALPTFERVGVPSSHACAMGVVLEIDTR